MNELELVINESGRPVTTSVIIANVFGKNHKDVLKKIKEKVNLFNERNFSPVKYEDSKGELRPMYLLDRDFATYLIMGFTGSSADEWKLKYIDAFNRMEEELKNVVSISKEDQLKLMLFSDDKMEVAQAHKELVSIEIHKATVPLLTTIEEQKPAVNFSNTVSAAKNCIDIGAMAKLCAKNGVNIGRNKLFQFLRSKFILMSDNIPYQKYIDSG